MGTQGSRSLQPWCTQMSYLDPSIEDHAELVAARVEALLRRRQTTVVPEYVTTSEASIFLNMPLKTLAFWREKGAGPPFSRVGRHVRYHIDDLRAWMRERRVETGGER